MGRYGRYEILHELGRGAMAAVYQARDPVLSRFVAIKVLHKEIAASGPTALQRFFNEAKTVANVRNPHVVEVFDFGKQGREYFLVMEFVDGRSLQGLLKQLPPGAAPAEGGGEPLDPLLTAAIVCQAAEGLEIAGRHGVVHRDIKPENLMINQQGYLKVADFGIAHLQDESLTRTGAVLGSPLYMSPEQVRGLKNISSQSDMFSLGAVFYRCLAGRPPFTSANLTELFKMVAREAHVPLWKLRPGLDPALCRISETLLQKDPARRGGGPRWLRGELRNLLMSQGIADPMELVGAHLQELAERGIQTTWSDVMVEEAPRTYLRSRQPTEPATGVLPAAGRSRPFPSRRRGSWAWVAAGAAAVTASLAAGAWFGLMPLLPRSPRPELAALALPAPGDNPKGFRAKGKLREPAAPGGTDAVPVVGAHAAQAEYQVALAALGREPGFPGGGAGVKASETQPAASAGHPAAATAVAAAATATPPAASPAEVRVQTSPPFAEVYLEGKFIGIAPVHLKALPSGSHRFLIKGKASEPLDTLVLVAPGKAQFRFNLAPRNVALDAD